MARAANSRRRDPAGRVDTLAIRLLGRAVSLHGDPIVRTIYGTFKPEIDQAIRGGLGGLNVRVPEVLQYPAEVQGQRAPKTAAASASTPPPRKSKPAAQPEVEPMTMTLGPDGVYEVCDAR
jgi:hypothetical protein